MNALPASLSLGGSELSRIVISPLEFSRFQEKRAALMMAASIPWEPALTIDRDFLEDLRKRFGSAAGGEMEDPHFRAVAASVFKDGDSRKWPFADPATFLDARFIENGLQPEVLEALDVALIGVPMDLGVTNRAGARLGPRAVRAVERIGPYEHVLRVAPMGGLTVADVGDVPMRSRFGLAECHADIEACYRMIAATGVILCRSAATIRSPAPSSRARRPASR